MDATYAMAHALHGMVEDVCHGEKYRKKPLRRLKVRKLMENPEKR